MAKFEEEAMGPLLTSLASVSAIFLKVSLAVRVLRVWYCVARFSPRLSHRSVLGSSCAAFDRSLLHSSCVRVANDGAGSRALEAMLSSASVP
eukprot:2512479-Rhodomonas_salina.1